MSRTTFISDNFLLQSEEASRLYHDYAAGLPIIDYHNHLSPQQIAEDINFTNITEAWLYGDHYKWRAMRANGISEHYITGDSSDVEKFGMWAETVPMTMRNPLFHWTHLELKRYFGIDALLTGNTAQDIYKKSSDLLNQKDFSTNALLLKMKVQVVCTTDHPTDDLAYHKQHKEKNSELHMLPTFRPDKFLIINGPEFVSYLEALEERTSQEIQTFDDLVFALAQRIEDFDKLGCRLSDHGLEQLFNTVGTSSELTSMLIARRKNVEIGEAEARKFQMSLLIELAKIYHTKNWTMQLHLGPIRNNNTRLMRQVGADVGADSIGDFEQSRGLSYFLDHLNNEDKLTKTILYNLNPRDNEVFATMAGNFNDDTIAGKVQWGSAWWFLDQKDGIEKQLNALSNMGLISRFIGMLTDSRSFLSFPRHEYFRRILCNLIGQDIVNGELPNDIDWLGKMVENICYYNARDYFKFDHADDGVIASSQIG
jgi:glucuronate isomerase